MRDLIDGYFALRQTSQGLAEHSPRFEGLPWRDDGGEAVRSSNGWKLSVYRIEGQIEASVLRPDGTCSTYS